jgi:HEAT repeat protein
LKTLAGDDHGPAIQAMKILNILHQEIPAELLFAHYAHDEMGMGSQEAEWGRALLQYGTRLPAETLITIACECINYRQDYDDEDIVETLSKLGDYIVDALLAKLPDYGILDAGLLSRVIRSLYEYIPEEKLLTTLTKNDGDRYIAASILALTGDELYLPLLLSLLEQQKAHPEAYCRVLSALALFRERFPLDVLLTALQAKNGAINDTALDILRELNAELDVSQLVEPLKVWLLANKDDHSWYETACSCYAIAALSFCGKYAPVDLLIPLLKDRHLRDKVLEALVRLSQHVPFEVFFALLTDQDNDIRDGAAIGLGKQKERVQLEKLLTLFSLHIDQNDEHDEDDEDDEERIDHKGIAQAVIEVLIELGEYASIEKIEVFLQHEDEEVRAGARRVLVELAACKPQDYIVREWWGADDDEKVRPSVLKAQIALGDQASFDTWIDTLDDEGSRGLPEGAAQVLDALARVVPTKILDLALECDRPEMRMTRLRAWSVLGQVDEIIAAACSDKQSPVRQRAIEILGDLKHPAAIEPLARLLRNQDDSSLLSALLEALRKLGSAVPFEPLLECCGYREQEWYKWGHFGWEPGTEAAQALKQTHPAVFRTLVPLAEAMVRGELPAGTFASRTQGRIADAIGAIGRSEPHLLAILIELLD